MVPGWAEGDAVRQYSRSDLAKYQARGKTVDIIGPNRDSAHRHQRLSGRLGAEH
jgi:hypothetical protein